ncbi:hypothetical protein TcG_10145 [Trypanosoma cruzi]|uniref:SKP1 component POZ domain-containing protein n=2 Tax=Trypanosoma cruzi TaxID=5693 RepID=V5BDJ1_TRYCR|nr:hypothetical protein TCDM_14079 [Trypanosoma cruzi Dm28c]PBJ76258.1 hypothetical protein BCY84_09633 [Trypanosoma cruzi cruzi]PBJ77289.1 hypothetical protein BCY84_06799 [Trypanosoma cruzi cruzi]PWV03111.1 hypothetical protein C4B63_1g63 [Trypanosoma cruzi]RNF07520.1 hypothetical protein TcG_10145 [Trypanosoma cruzi]
MSKSVTACDIILCSQDGMSFTIPANIAWEHIGLLNALALLDEGGCAEMPPLELDYPELVVKYVSEYLMNTDRRLVDIPKPLTAPVSHFAKAWEMVLVRDIEKHQLLIPVLECSTYLRIDVLHDLLAAFLAERIQEISKAAPSIMEGAESLRQYLQLENEWTPEEMVHLEEEMRYAKEMNPGAY